jgi:ATP-dependent Clp protease ATP-binding subunit ClpA
MPDAHNPSFAVDAKEMLKEAYLEATKLGHGYLGTEHLLLGLLARENSGTTVLEEVGIGLDALRAATLKLIDDATPLR